MEERGHTRIASTDEGARCGPPPPLPPARAKSQRFSGGQYEENRAATGCRKVSNLVNGERPGVRIAHAPLRRWPRCAQRDCRSAVTVDPRRSSGSLRGRPTADPHRRHYWLAAVAALAAWTPCRCMRVRSFVLRVARSSPSPATAFFFLQRVNPFCIGKARIWTPEVYDKKNLNTYYQHWLLHCIVNHMSLYNNMILAIKFYKFYKFYQFYKFYC